MPRLVYDAPYFLVIYRDRSKVYRARKFVSEHLALNFALSLM